MKLETNLHYFSALFLCAALVWLVGPLVLSFVFDAILVPPVPGKFVAPAAVRATLTDTLTYIGALGWVIAVIDWVQRGFPWHRRGWVGKG